MKRRIIALVLFALLSFALALPVAASGPLEILSSNPEYIGIGLLIGIVLSLIICLVLKGQLKNVRKGTTAENYVAGDLHLTGKSDRFTHRTTVRTKIESKKD